MKKPIISILPLATALLPFLGTAKELNNYSNILSSIKNGKNITTVINFSNCKPSIQMIGHYNPKSIVAYNNSILFSDGHFTRNNPQYPNQSILEYVTYKIDNSNNVQITTQFLNPTNYKPMSSNKPISVNCIVDKDQARFFSS